MSEIETARRSHRRMTNAQVIALNAALTARLTKLPDGTAFYADPADSDERVAADLCVSVHSVKNMRTEMFGAFPKAADASGELAALRAKVEEQGSQIMNLALTVEDLTARVSRLEAAPANG
jgi:hypothetical protein